MTELPKYLAGLNVAASIIHKGNVERGFWPEGEKKNIGELLMLVTSELGEALEAHRHNSFSDPNNASSDKDLDSNTFRVEVKDTFEDEIADAVIRLMDMCAGLGINLEWHIYQKVKYNSTRPPLHGKAY